MTITTAYHVGSNAPGYLPDGEVTCWDDIIDARDALLTAMWMHCDDLAEACDDYDYDPECDECDVWWVATNATSATRDARMDGGENGIQVQLPTGRALPLVFWMEPVAMDHATECEPLDA